jgi:hypothetical protein
MKKKILTFATTIGLALGAFAQGSINLDNSTVGGGLSSSATTATAGQGNYFSGTYSFQLWELNGSTISPTINSSANPNDNNVSAYAALTTLGYTLEKSFTNKVITAGNAGVFSLGEVDMANVTPAASSVVLALVAWTGGSSFLTASKAGVFAFVNPTANYTLSPAPTPSFLTGWSSSSDLVMTPVAIPEPTTLALAGLGGAALLAIRRRKA